MGASEELQMAARLFVIAEAGGFSTQAGIFFATMPAPDLGPSFSAPPPSTSGPFSPANKASFRSSDIRSMPAQHSPLPLEQSIGLATVSLLNRVESFFFFPFPSAFSMLPMWIGYVACQVFSKPCYLLPFFNDFPPTRYLPGLPG